MQTPIKSNPDHRGASIEQHRGIRTHVAPIHIAAQHRESNDDDEPNTLDTPLPKNFLPGDKVAAALARQIVEILIGQRPIRHIQSWTAVSVYQALRRTLSLNQQSKAHTPRGPVQIKLVRCTFPRARVVEATVLVHDGERTRASAIRLEVHHNHWRIAAFELA